MRVLITNIVLAVCFDFSTGVPSRVPTLAPTHVPTHSLAPTHMPTSFPTPVPTRSLDVNARPGRETRNKTPLIIGLSFLGICVILVGAVAFLTTRERRGARAPLPLIMRATSGNWGERQRQRRPSKVYMTEDRPALHDEIPRPEMHKQKTVSFRLIPGDHE